MVTEPHRDRRHDLSPGSAWLRAHTDGVVCFGGVDWWYHNRGHYDLQMMRELSADTPVLYVNSIGMRAPDPREGKRFLARIGGKLRSLRRGLHRADDNLWVLSPPTLPGPAGAGVTRSLLVRSVRRAAARAGITRPLVWVACPPAATAVSALAPAAVVYQRTDRYECFSGVDADAIRTLDARLKARADLTVFCAQTLFERERDECRDACVVDHGVDAPFFAAAEHSEPVDLRGIARPRVGFVGGIDGHTFDPALFNAVARRLPDTQFVLVGACSLPRDWCTLPNVHHLGRRDFADVPPYLAACDVLIMPWNRSSWIEACNPVKLGEYLASGRPIVTTDFPTLDAHRDVVRVAADADAFAAGIRDAVRDPGDAEARRSRVRNATWRDRSQSILEALAVARSADPKRSARRRTHVLRLAPDSMETSPPVDIAAFVILAGGLRASPLVTAAGRSIVDLWLSAEHTVLGAWLARWRELGAIGARPVRVVHDANLPAPWPRSGGSPAVTIERETKIVRGPAGVLRDTCAEYAGDRHVLVSEAARYLDGSLAPLLETHARTGAAITVAANPDGTPAGLYLLRCNALDTVATVGFEDLKEQWLHRAVERGLHVGVHRLAARGTMPIRTREELLAAARVVNGGRAVRAICPGALVAPGAMITDSIVMPGAMVQRNAIVTRSVLCPDALVEPDTQLADTIVRFGGVCTGGPPIRSASA